MSIHLKLHPEAMIEGYQKSALVEWLNGMLPHLSLPLEASDEELRECLSDGTILCSILNKLCPSAIEMGGDYEPGIANVERFLTALDELGLPGFEPSDLEQGSMVPVLQCLSTLRISFDLSVREVNTQNHSRKRWDLSEMGSLEGSDLSQDPLAALINLVRQENNEALHLKEGYYTELSNANILELMKSRILNNASLHSLFNIVNGILDDSIERRNGDMSHHVAYLLRKVLQVIERQIIMQAGNMKTQFNILKAREERYQLKIRALETLATGTTEEYEVIMNQLQNIKIEKFKIEDKKKHEEQDLMILKKQMDQSDIKILSLKEELEMTKRAHENRCLQLEANAWEAKVELGKKVNELQSLLTDSKKKVKELETFSESESHRWKSKECIYKNFVDHLCKALQDIRAASETTKHEILKTKRSYSVEFNYMGMKLKGLTDAAKNYHAVLLDNRRLYNEVQDLKGNIRVYCRIRPFLPGQSKKQTTIEYVGENGELVISNPSKQGKDSRKVFKFNKVFGPETSQEQVFLDTQPLIRSVLDGYNVCIFAYGQTGSGKTYTMAGPSLSSEEDWGVNYRALHDLFEISETRKSSIAYEVGVQMVEIYNEQVRDLLSRNGPQKRLGIWSTTQPNGLAVPEASMYPVKSTADVLELMSIGQNNRAVGATALNERSSRSHSVLTVHVHGADLDSGGVLRGSLHLVDLAGSERVERSEATGDRLKEAQHINKSLSALGDVIFSLSQKSSHVPYRNSKLTQVLQSSLGGQAKTLMFVQLNPDVQSYSETISTLKFAERVSGVELGAARSNKEGRYVRELMEQVAALKDVITNKDEEIERLQHLKPNSKGTTRGMSSLRYGSSSPRRNSIGNFSPSLSGGKRLELIGRSASDIDNFSEQSDKHSEAGSLRSVDVRHNRKFTSCSKPPVEEDFGPKGNDDVVLLGFGNGDSDERLSDISDSGLSMGTETDGSICSVVEYTLFPEVAKTEDAKVDSNNNLESKLVEDSQARRFHLDGPQAGNTLVEKTPSKNTSVPDSDETNLTLKFPGGPPKLVQTKSSRLSMTTKSSSKVPASARKSTIGSSSMIKPTSKRWQ